MITFSKSYSDFAELNNDMISIGYADDVIGNTFEEGVGFDDIDKMLMHIIEYVNDNRPGINNTSYPNCISFSANSYGFRYMKDNVGIAIATKVNRKTNDVTYNLSITFNKPVKFLGNNAIYKELDGRDDFNFEIIDKK